jgi:methylase of polypeptide subunit release factors
LFRNPKQHAWSNGWVDAAARRLAAGVEDPLCVDLCCGTGTIALSLASELPQASVHGVEVDAEAIGWASGMWPSSGSTSNCITPPQMRSPS